MPAQELESSGSITAVQMQVGSRAVLFVYDTCQVRSSVAVHAPESVSLKPLLLVEAVELSTADATTTVQDKNDKDLSPTSCQSLF